MEKLIFFGEDTVREGEDMDVEIPRPDLEKERVEEEDEKFVLEVEIGYPHTLETKLSDLCSHSVTRSQLRVG